MATQSAKKTSGSSRASSASRSARARLSAVDSSMGAENAMRFGAEAMRGFIANGAEEAQKAQQKAFAFSREGAENMARSADMATRTVNETIAISRENVEAIVECGNVMVNIGRSLTNEIYNFANNTFSDNVEMSKEIFSCRTINEMFDLCSKMVKGNVDNMFNESVRMSELMFQFATEAAEPINERISETTERFSKVMAS